MTNVIPFPARSRNVALRPEGTVPAKTLETMQALLREFAAERPAGTDSGEVIDLAERRERRVRPLGTRVVASRRDGALIALAEEEAPARAAVSDRPSPRPEAEIIDLAAWREGRRR